jgi:hypothetical protein
MCKGTTNEGEDDEEAAAAGKGKSDAEKEEEEEEEGDEKESRRADRGMRGNDDNELELELVEELVGDIAKKKSDGEPGIELGTVLRNVSS